MILPIALHRVSCLHSSLSPAETRCAVLDGLARIPSVASGAINDETLRRIQRDLDLEEERL